MIYKRFISILLAFTLCLTMFAGCSSDGASGSDQTDMIYGDDGFNYEDDSTYEDPTQAPSGEDWQDQEQEDSNEDLEYGQTDHDPVPSDVLNRKFRLTDAQAAELKKLITDIRVSYTNSDQYGLQQSLEDYKTLSHVAAPPSQEVISNGTVDYNTLLNIVLCNNEKSPAGSYYGTLSRDYIEKTIKVITDTVNYHLARNPYIDRNVLDHKLKNLRLFTYDDFGNAFYTSEENLIALNISTMESLFQQGYGSFEDIVSHETNHLLQSAELTLPDKVEIGTGMNYAFKDKKQNALYWEWYVEGAAEAGTVLEHNIPVDKAMVYVSYVRSLFSIISTYAFCEENVYTLTQLTTQRDMNKFFELFGCTTEADKKEIMEMMVAYELTLNSNGLYYSSATLEQMQIEDPYTFEKKLRCSIGQTLAKQFFRNLAEKLQGGEATLEDVFSLMAAFELRMAQEVWYDSDEQVAYMDGFYKTYTAVQDAFFKQIGAETGLSEENIRAYYVDHFHTADLQQYENKMLTNAQNEFYKKLCRETNSDGVLTVVEVVANQKN